MLAPPTLDVARVSARTRYCLSSEAGGIRPSAFQEVYHPESNYLGKAPTAQLTHIDAAGRLFSVPLTRITSVPECAVSSVGFRWGSGAVSRSCGVSVGLAEALDLSGRPGTGCPGTARGWWCPGPRAGSWSRQCAERLTAVMDRELAMADAAIARTRTPAPASQSRKNAGQNRLGNPVTGIADLLLTISAAWFTVRTSCTGSTSYRTDYTRCAGAIPRAGPRPVQREFARQ